MPFCRAKQELRIRPMSPPRRVSQTVREEVATHAMARCGRNTDEGSTRLTMTLRGVACCAHEFLGHRECAVNRKNAKCTLGFAFSRHCVLSRHQSRRSQPHRRP
eukprot:Amastigsp_a510256_65.p4 type:complete len:104 gc:universal Amastigsp_a510256_65:1083-772(-)